MDYRDIRGATDDEVLDWVRHLVDDRQPEGPTLDYKSVLSFGTPSEKKEVAKDFSAFSNSFGGNLIVGVDEIEGVPTGEYTMEDPDPELADRVRDYVTDALQPRLPPSWTWTAVEVEDNRIVYVISMAPSLIGPHMVTAAREFRFYRRNGARSEPMTESEVDAAYRSRVARDNQLDGYLERVDANDVWRRRADMGFSVAMIPYRSLPGAISVETIESLRLLEILWPSQGIDSSDLLGWSHAPYGVHSKPPWNQSYRDDGYCRVFDSGEIVVWFADPFYTDEAHVAHWNLGMTIAHVWDCLVFYERVDRRLSPLQRSFRLFARVNNPHEDLVGYQSNSAFSGRRVLRDSSGLILGEADVELGRPDWKQRALRSIVHQLGRYMGMPDLENIVGDDESGLVVNIPSNRFRLAPD